MRAGGRAGGRAQHLLLLALRYAVMQQLLAFPNYRNNQSQAKVKHWNGIRGVAWLGILLAPKNSWLPVDRSLELASRSADWMDDTTSQEMFEGDETND